MGYRTLRQCIEDLRKHGHLIELTEPIDPHLEMAEIQRRVYASGGPAILFSNPTGTQFPMVSNLFGTLDRARFIFRDTIENVKRAIELKVEPEKALKQPFKYWRAPFTAMQMRPKVVGRGSVLSHETQIQSLPQLKSWPEDGGAFITLPQVYSEDVRAPGVNKSNLGMYRVQLSGNQYQTNQQIGLHYQIHRGIGVHHRAAIDAGQPFRVNIFVGGSPAMTLSAVMPLPEGMSELTFAGALAGHRIPMIRQKQSASIYANADFCIVGTIDPNQLLPEGPFGDHLGYYSLTHDFPVLNVEKVYHREDAIWPFTVVGRPPQEDTVFGELIHELTGPIIPTVLAGVHQVNAVDASGVHPLLLAIGSERYVPYQNTSQPQEILTQANAILGQGQMSLAKYLWIVDQAASPNLNANDIEAFVQVMLERVDWKRDLHFNTRTTIDTLDYSGTGFNQGSKVVIAAAGDAVRELATRIPGNLKLPAEFSNPQVCLPGVLAIQGPACQTRMDSDAKIEQLCSQLPQELVDSFPLVVVTDDSAFCSRSLNNFLWTTFTRSNPAIDIYGTGAEIIQKHWGCSGCLVIDARRKPHHAPPLIEDSEITAKVDAMAAGGGPLSQYL